MTEKLTLEQINEKLSNAKRDLKIGGIYGHYKDKRNTYRVLNFVMIEATQEVGVVYEALYEEAYGVQFLRPLDNFLENVEVDGRLVQRFSLLTEDR